VSLGLKIKEAIRSLIRFPVKCGLLFKLFDIFELIMSLGALFFEWQNTHQKIGANYLYSK